MALKKGVTIIVLNYKTYAKTEECLNGLSDTAGTDFNVVVVDNAPYNEEFGQLAKRFDHKANFRFYASGENAGYARGNNFGFEKAKADGILLEYVAIVNNDVQIDNPSLFSDLIQEFEQLSDAAMISPKIIHKATGIIQGPYHKLVLSKMMLEAIMPVFSWLRIRREQKWRNSITETQPVYRTMGSFLLTSSELFEQCKGFDPNTFLGSEEDILAEKFSRMSRRFYFVPQLSVLHDHGFSASTEPKGKIEMAFRESQLYYFKEYRGYGTLRLKMLNFSSRMIDFWRRVR